MKKNLSYAYIYLIDVTTKITHCNTYISVAVGFNGGNKEI